MASKTQIQQQLDQVLDIQSNALRRLHSMPENIRALIDAQVLGASTPTADGQGMIYVLGDVELTIFPFTEELELRDMRGANTPLRLQLGSHQDFDRQMVLEILGYATLVRRGEGHTATDLLEQLNAHRQPART